MTIKQNHIHPLRTLALLGAMAAALWGCQTDDFAEPSNLPQGELQLTVTDSGYTGHTVNYDNGTLRELPPTRATDAGYKTTFTAGDKIGFYAVSADNSVANNNIALTLTNVGGGTLQWQPPTGVKLSATADRYFAYYPYKSSPGNVTATVTDADAFFASIISAWTPTADQSGTNYTAQDLMVGSGTLANNKLTITLAHKMGLAVIKLPTGITDAAFYINLPYTGVSGEYRYLLKPSTATTLLCRFKDGGVARGFVISPTIHGGNYKEYRVQ